MKKICEYCGLQFNIDSKYKSERKKRFCSLNCAATFNGKLNKGRTHLPEINAKKGRAGKENAFFGKTHSEKSLQLMSDKKRGISWNELYGQEKAAQMRENLSNSITGEKNPFYGKCHTSESRSKMGRDMSGKNNPMYGNGYLLKGERNGSWKGGISHGDYGPNFNEKLKTEIRKRDLFVCKICNKNGFIVHHINYIKSDNSKKNLITLCRSCHGKTGFSRNHWIAFFNSVMEEQCGKDVR